MVRASLNHEAFLFLDFRHFKLLTSLTSFLTGEPRPKWVSHTILHILKGKHYGSKRGQRNLFANVLPIFPYFILLRFSPRCGRRVALAIFTRDFVIIGARKSPSGYRPVKSSSRIFFQDTRHLFRLIDINPPGAFSLAYFISRRVSYQS